MPDLSWKGVIESSTGDLIRVGYCDFENDGQFDPATEEIRTDVPKPAYTRELFAATTMHRWNGSSWEEVPQP